MANSEDTEITLGTGKMLAIFFGLVALCAVFFGMGFSLGKSSAAPNGAGVASAVSSASSARPTAVKPSGSAASPDLSFYKTVGQKDQRTNYFTCRSAPTATSKTRKARGPSWWGMDTIRF